MHSVGSFEDAIRDDDFHIIISTKKETLTLHKYY